MNVSREISIYEKEGDEFLASFQIDNIDLKYLIDVLDINLKDDPFICKIYHLTKDKYLKLSKYVPELLKYQFEEFSFYFECYQL